MLIPATLVVAADHLIRGAYWPQTVFGVVSASPWRWLEHAGWVIFEDVILIICIRQSVAEMRETSRQTAELEWNHTQLKQSSQELNRLLDKLRFARDEAEASNRAKSEFLANMSHEIRTPLTGILGFTEVLRCGVDSTEEAQGCLNTIHSSGQHLLTLINDILDLSKIEAGRMEFEQVRCSPHEIISDVLSVLRVRAQEKCLRLDCLATTPVPESILTDPARLRQLLMNLIGNDRLRRLLDEADRPRAPLWLHPRGPRDDAGGLPRVGAPHSTHSGGRHLIAIWITIWRLVWDPE